MAELPRYQEMGLIAADQPRINFAATQEEARYYATINQQLNRLSSFAFGIAAEKQAEENRLIGIQMRSELEGEVQKQLSDIKVRMETGQLNDVEQVQQEIQAMQGLVKPLAEIDINQANALMSSIAAGGRQLIAKSADTQIKMYQEQVAAQLGDMMPAFQNNISTIYETTFVPEDIQTQKAELRNKLYAMVATTSPNLLPAAMKEFESRWNAARDESLIGYFTSPEFGRSTSSGVRALRNGNAGKYTDVWNSLGVDEQNALITKYLARDAQEATLRNRAESDMKQNRKTEKMIVMDQYFLGVMSGDEVIRRSIAGDFELTTAEHKSIRSGDTAKINERAYETLESLVVTGQIGDDQIDTMVTEGRISLKQGNSLKSKLRSNISANMDDAFKYINNAFVPDPMSPGDRNNKQRAAELRNQLLEEEQRAITEGIPFNPRQRSIELVQERKQLDDYKALETARQRLRDELQQAGLLYREDYTAEDLRSADVETGAIKRILRQIKDIQGG